MTISSSVWWATPIDDTLHCVVFVEPRPDVMRVISLRVADKKEVKRFAANCS